jgi:hypothetical protein
VMNACGTCSHISPSRWMIFSSVTHICEANYLFTKTECMKLIINFGSIDTQVFHRLYRNASGVQEKGNRV